LTHRAFRRGAVAISQKRLTMWIGIAGATANMSAVGGTITHVANAALLALRPFTIIKTIMDYALRSDQAGAMEHQVCSVGAAVVSDQALAIGVTAIPTPVTDRGSDLFWLHRNIMADESALTDRTRGETHVQVISKAMRKINDDQSFVFVAEFDGLLSDGLILTSLGWLLIKLH